jgi:hypothetical protein
MRRVCPKCGSTSVIMFDADEDWCTQCKARFPGETTSPHSELTALRAEVSALRLRAETAERELTQLDKYFTSANSVPVERATILAKDYWAIRALPIKDRP